MRANPKGRSKLSGMVSHAAQESFAMPFNRIRRLRHRPGTCFIFYCRLSLTLSLFSFPVETYFAYPKDNKNPEKAILILSDIFGIYTNSQLIADEFAAQGYLAVIPDLFQGDTVKIEDFESGKVDLQAWLPKHQTTHVDPVVEATIKHLREELGVKRIGGVGYCFGGKVCASITVTAALQALGCVCFCFEPFSDKKKCSTCAAS